MEQCPRLLNTLKEERLFQFVKYKAMAREDIRGHCNRDFVYSDNGRCDIWDDSMQEDVNKCDDYIENF